MVILLASDSAVTLLLALLSFLLSVVWHFLSLPLAIEETPLFVSVKEGQQVVYGF